MKLEIQQVSKSYGHHVALKNLSLKVGKARVLALIGPSGGGKSTLLRLLGGLEWPDQGRLVINDDPVPDTEASAIGYRRRNGFLFQQFNLFPHMDALRNIALPLEKVHGMTASEADDIARGVLDRFGLSEHAGKLPSALSGGQQQRVGIARAVASRSAILFLDEPTSALDPEMTSDFLELIEELAHQGQDIILSTHEMGFARAVADQVAFLAAGEIHESGPPSQIFGQPVTASCARFLSKVTRW